MKLKYLSLLLFAFIALISCQEKEVIVGKKEGKIITITGKIQQVKEGELVYVYEFDNQSRNILDSVQVTADGTFAVKVGVDAPKIIGLNIYEQHVSVIASDTDVQLLAKGSGEEMIFELSGSKDNDFYEEYLSLRTEASQKMEDLQYQLQQDPSREGQMKVQVVHQIFVQQFTNKAKQLIERMDGSVVSMYVAALLDPEEHPEYMEKLSAGLASKYPQSEDIKQFNEEVLKATKITLNRMAPDFTLTKLDSEEKISLADLRGKYVLIDFWASWCGPCRQENPNVKLAYEKYKSKGFEILGVSTDANPALWKKAVQDDGLPWVHVIDSEGKASSMYNVMTIPFTVLVDPEGKIVGKNLRGAMLEETLADLL